MPDWTVQLIFALNGLWFSPRSCNSVSRSKIRQKIGAMRGKSRLADSYIDGVSCVSWRNECVDRNTVWHHGIQT